MFAPFLAALALAQIRTAKVIDVTIPQSVVTFDVHCSPKITDGATRIRFYEGFFTAMAVWQRVVPTRAHFRLVGAGEQADFQVFIGPEQFDPKRSRLVGEIWWGLKKSRLQGKIYISTKDCPTQKVVQSISLHELGHLLGLDDSYAINAFGYQVGDGWGVMGALDEEDPVLEPTPEEIDAVRRHP